MGLIRTIVKQAAIAAAVVMTQRIATRVVHRISSRRHRQLPVKSQDQLM